jgi:hypothetical protein
MSLCLWGANDVEKGIRSSTIGESIISETELPGAILTRVAVRHLN